MDPGRQVVEQERGQGLSVGFVKQAQLPELLLDLGSPSASALEPSTSSRSLASSSEGSRSTGGGM